MVALIPESKWGPWGNWGGCSKTCGGGSQSRSRQCTRSCPQYPVCANPSSAVQQRVCGTGSCCTGNEINLDNLYTV